MRAQRKKAILGFLPLHRRLEFCPNLSKVSNPFESKGAAGISKVSLGGCSAGEQRSA
jgi:hypothetical protein